jgi:hypothetical protein
MTGTAKGWRIARRTPHQADLGSAHLEDFSRHVFPVAQRIPEVHLGFGSQTRTHEHICNTYERSTNDCKVTSGDNGIAMAPRLSKLKSDLFCILPQSSHL